MNPKRVNQVRVVPRNMRWEVEVNGTTRRLIDWLCTKERAIDHALERANELVRWESASEAIVTVMRPDRTEEERMVVRALRLAV